MGAFFSIQPMRDERKQLNALGMKFADVVTRYENPPPLPAGASVVAKRDDYPANDGGTKPELRSIQEDKTVKEGGHGATPGAAVADLPPLQTENDGAGCA